MIRKQKVSMGTGGRLYTFLRAKYVEELSIKKGDTFCMRKGRGRRLIIDFVCKEGKEGNKECITLQKNTSK